MNIKQLNEAISELLDDKIQCVLKIQDVGNEYVFKGMVADNTDYASEYDMEIDFYDRLQSEDPTTQFILAYHKDGENVFYDEDDVLLDLDMTEDAAFDRDYNALNNSNDNTVIPDKDMIN